MKGQSLPHQETSSAEADLERCAEKALLGVGSDGQSEEGMDELCVFPAAQPKPLKFPAPKCNSCWGLEVSVLLEACF